MYNDRQHIRQKYIGKWRRQITDGRFIAEECGEIVSQRRRGCKRHQYGDRGRRIRGPGGPGGQREIHPAADDRRPGGHFPGGHLHRRSPGQRPGAQGPGCGDDFQKLHPVSADDGIREPGVWTEAFRVRKGRDSRTGDGDGKAFGDHGAFGPSLRAGDGNRPLQGGGGTGSGPQAEGAPHG